MMALFSFTCNQVQAILPTFSPFATQGATLVIALSIVSTRISHTCTFQSGSTFTATDAIEDAARADASKAAFAFSYIFLTASLIVSFFASTKLAMFMELGAV
jgi:hypothetical protein